jgi:putative addiction module antidote
MNAPLPNAKQLKIVKIGNSSGVILPKEELERLRLEVGDNLSYAQTADGLSLTCKDPDFDRQMEIARGLMKKYRNALSELAK